jgi:putative hydroxymethylpyrimidine transport system substrate-binding protein
MDIIGKPGKAFYPEEEGVPPYDELILVANKSSLGDSRLRLFVDAVEKATQFLINHPQESWKLFITAHKDLDNELNKRAWAATLPRFALRPAALDKARYERFAIFLKEQKLIKSIPPLETYAVELP